MSKVQAEKYMSAFEVISKINTLSKDGLRVKFGTSDPIKIQLIADINLNIIKELIDKEIPMKPIITSYIPLCHRCHEETVVSTDYSMKKYGRCINEECGQRLDWSDEE